MRIIKEYRLFESITFNETGDFFLDSLKLKIKDILQPIENDSFVTRVYRMAYDASSSEPIVIIDVDFFKSYNGRDVVFFRGGDIINQLEELVKIGIVTITASFVEANGNITIRMFRNLNDFIGVRALLHTIRVKIVVENSMECSNPECDNILDEGDNKCSVCGENK